MSEERELRDLLEATQERLKEAEARLSAAERARALAAQRAQELERAADAERARIAALEEQVRLGNKDVAAQTLGQLKARLETLELRLTQTESISPRLPASGVCSRCGSSKIASPVRLDAHVESRSGPVHATFDRDPSAAFFKQPVNTPIAAAICGACGYVELNATTAAELWTAFDNTRTRAR